MTDLVGPDIDADGRVEVALKRLVEHLSNPSARASHRLPSERSLAAVLHCSRNTVREALARLRERGLVEVRARSGIYEPTKARSDGAALQAQALTALQLVGPEVARLAAAQFAEEHVGRFEDITSDISRALIHRDAVAASRQFLVFYRELGRLAGNAYLQDVLAKIATDGNLAPKDAMAPQQRTHEAFFAQHVEVFQALRRGDGRRAEKLAQRCIRAFANLMHLKDGTAEPRSEVLP